MNAQWKDIRAPTRDVLIVEDDPVLRPLMVEMLSEVRARIVAFETADGALNHLTEGSGYCSLLIADHGVPGKLSGTQLAALFRAKWPKSAVIVTSGYELAPATLPEGVVYLQKPWAGGQLVDMVMRLLQPGIAFQRG